MHPSHSYRIVTLPDSTEDIEHRLKVSFTTLTEYSTFTVTSTMTQHNYQTCYSSDPGISECQGRSNDDLTVELDGVTVSWESVISPSRVTRQAEETVEEIYPASEKVQVVQPHQAEPAAVVYPTVVQDQPELRHHDHETDNEPAIDNADEHVDDEVDEDVVVATTESMTADKEETTILEVEPEVTTTSYDYDDLEANPARHNEVDGPVVTVVETELDSSQHWEERNVVIRQKTNHNHCMEMNSGLLISVLSTVLTTVTQTEVTTVNAGVNTVLFKADGGCLPSNVDDMFTSCS